MRIAWATDVHLNFLERSERAAFAASLEAQQADGVVLCGDIAEAASIEGCLRELEDTLQRPIWFVLGNHDFYRSSIASVREAMRTLSRSAKFLRWLPDAGVVSLNNDLALIGHDGWGDGRLGAGRFSTVLLNDFIHIRELAFLPTPERFATLAALGDESAAQLEPMLRRALQSHRRVMLATHVPPFREACWHEGRISDDDWLPYFTNHAMGTMLLRVMSEHPDQSLLVLCGHTHGGGECQPAANIRVLTGAAEYGAPEPQLVLEFQGTAHT